MKCPKCGSGNVNVQAVTIVKNKRHGLFYWLCFGWLFDLLLWLFLFLPRLLFQLCKKTKIMSSTHSEAVCQNCGHRWRVR